MTVANSAEGIRAFVSKHYIEPARRAGEQHVRVVAGDVHRDLKLKNRVPNVCQVLDSRKFCEENQLVIEDKKGPPSGMGTRMVFVYRLNGDVPPPNSPSSFAKLHGLLREALASLGGGEEFLRRERRHFQTSGREQQK
jgi:hypothetical protein